MNNFFKSNPQEGLAKAYYPNPIHIDEETGKVSLQNVNESDFFQSSAQNNFANANERQPEAKSQTKESRQNSSSNMNMEKIMSMLKGGGSNDLLSSMLTGGMNAGNQQNPMMMQALSKLMNQTKKSDSSTPITSQSATTFEEM